LASIEGLLRQIGRSAIIIFDADKGMLMTSMWMVRSDGGKRYDDFRDLAAVGIGFPEIAELVHSGADRKALLTAYSTARPGIKQHSAMSAASQVYRFVNEISIGDLVVTYSPTNRSTLSALCGKHVRITRTART
jgi:predicted Mrr-cat superfamily restriction endonuclease